MRSIVILAVLAAAAAAFFFIGPSVLMGGPSKSEIERVSREIARETGHSLELAAGANITPKGLCSKHKQDGVFACIVELTVEGKEPETYVTEIRKDENGKWTAVR